MVTVLFLCRTGFWYPVALHPPHHLRYNNLPLKGKQGLKETSLCWQGSILVKALIFPVVMYRCESWTIKKTERWGIDAFKLWHWRALLRIPWTARRSSQSILKEINPEYSLEGLMLKLQYFGHLIQGANSLEKNPDVGKDRRQEKGATEDEMVGWCHQFLGHDFE